MLKPKTHFEQIPLEIVRKIVEEQIRQPTPADVPEFDGGGECQKQLPKRLN